MRRSNHNVASTNLKPRTVHSSSSSSSGSDEEKPRPLALAAGCQPDHIYKDLLPAWRFRIRSLLVENVARESPILGRVQRACRCKFLDEYFLWSSILGTHSAFMVGLPIFWWFSFNAAGRGLVNILMAGVYLSSFVKDLFCVPRPYIASVERLTISSHGLEYGFPSTHSTNSVSLSLYMAQLYTSSVSRNPLLDSIVYAACSLYAASVVLGRMYCGMHSLTDCIFGTALGAAIWYANLVLTPHYEAFLSQATMAVPALVIPLCLILVSVHPEPVDNCPCFEDAIAFIATASGIAIGHWRSLTGSALCPASTNGSLWFTAVAPNLPVQMAAAASKLILGVGCIFLWRVAAKRCLHILLPPLFKFFRPVVDLPRRFYVPAKDYKQIEKRKPLQSVPSVLKLVDMGSDRSSKSARPQSRLRTGSLTELAKTAMRRQAQSSKRLQLIHYDVDVLTKVIVYSGIGVIAT